MANESNNITPKKKKKKKKKEKIPPRATYKLGQQFCEQHFKTIDGEILAVSSKVS